MKRIYPLLWQLIAALPRLLHTNAFNTARFRTAVVDGSLMNIIRFVWDLNIANKT